MSYQEENEQEDLSEENGSGSSCFSYLGPTSLAPFEIYRVLGFDWYVGVKMIEENGNLIIIYGMGHLISFVNIESNKSESICVHGKNIVEIELDLSGRFVITCDKEIAIIWDRKCSKENSQTILRVFNKPFGQLSIISAAISSFAKYVILVSEPNSSGHYQIQFWLWSFGTRECDAETTIPKEYGKIKGIRFSHALEEEGFFVITLSHAAVFGFWDSESEVLKLHFPDTKRFNELNSSCYVNNTRLAVSVTSRGRLIVWSDLLYEILKKPIINNEKNLIKILPLRNCSINDVRMVDEFITTVDDCGEIRFYDSEIRLIYFCNSWKLPSIFCINSNTVPRHYKLVDDEYLDSEEAEGENIEVIYTSNCPNDCTIEAKPFIVRSFVIMTKDGQIFYCDVVKNICKPLMFHCEDYFLVSGHHPSTTLVACCCASGRIIYFDYFNNAKIAEYTLQEMEVTKNSEQLPYCTCLNIISHGSIMALGLSNGLLCLVEIMTGKLLTLPFNFTKYPVDRIIFGSKLKYILYTDTSFSVIFVRSVADGWSFVGKYRYHCEPIVGLILTEFNNYPKLITIGEDRILVEYDIQKSIDREQMVMIRDIRLEQSAKITAAKLLPSTVLMADISEKGQIILTANNEYKFKIFDAYSLECLLTVLGPIFESPIRHIMINSETELFSKPILIVASKQTLGAILTPLDGNPFRCSGLPVHHGKINTISSAINGTQVCVQGAGDHGGTIWILNEKHILENFNSGGSGLDPFCSLLPGGKDGWLFKEMQDFFYYMQLISHNEEWQQQYVIRDIINISDMVDYMRAVGYFPSEWEIKNMMTELKRASGSTTIVPTKISFCDIVKLYLNHKPVDGYRLKDIFSAVKHISQGPRSEILSGDEYEYTDDLESDSPSTSIEISLEQILDVLTDKAEAVSKEQAIKYLDELIEYSIKSKEEPENEFITQASQIDRLPATFNILNFCKVLLGIEIASLNGNDYYSVFGDIINPAQIEPKLDNRPKNSPIMEKCLKGGLTDNHDVEEQDNEEEEEETSRDSSSISSFS